MDIPTKCNDCARNIDDGFECEVWHNFIEDCGYWKSCPPSPEEELAALRSRVSELEDREEAWKEAIDSNAENFKHIISQLEQENARLREGLVRIIEAVAKNMGILVIGDSTTKICLNAQATLVTAIARSTLGVRLEVNEGETANTIEGSGG